MTADGIDRSFGAPRFDVVLRGYDRRQVDEHIARLQRVLSRMRSDLESARGRHGAVPPLMGPPAPPGARPRPSPRPRFDGIPVGDGRGGEGGDVVGTFTERMNAILQAAEEEAAEIRGKALSSQAAARAEEETIRSTLTDLVRQRDAVLADLTRVRGQLEGLLSMPTTVITLPVAESGPDVPEPDADTAQPLPGTSEPSETAAVPDDETDDAPAEPPSPEPLSAERPPQRLRFNGSTVRYPARPTVQEPVQEAPFDLFRPASEDRRPEAPELDAADGDQATDGSPVERTSVLRPVVRAPETADDDRGQHDPAVQDGAAAQDDTEADASTSESTGDGDGQPVEQAPAARYG
jgi:syndecan 1